MAKAKASGPDPSRKPGGEGLPYSDLEEVIGGPESKNMDLAGGSLGEGKGVKGSASLPPVKKGKGGPKG